MRSRLRLPATPWGAAGQELLCPWNFPGKNTGVGCQFLLQGIYSTQGWNLRLLRLLHWQVDSLPLAPPGKLLLIRGFYKSMPCSTSLQQWKYL